MEFALVIAATVMERRYHVHQTEQPRRRDMDQRNKAWRQVPPYIWGDGATNSREGARYTDTFYLLHARAPRFLCEYEFLDGPVAKVEVDGEGASLVVRTGSFAFSRFVFLDPEPSPVLLRKLCVRAAVMRDQLIEADLADAEDEAEAYAAEQEDGPADPFGLTDEVGAGPGNGVAFASSHFFTSAAPDRVAKACAVWFPEGWREQWREVEIAAGSKQLIHVKGVTVRVHRGDATVEEDRWLPREQRYVINAQMIALTRDVLPEQATAMLLRGLEEDQERVREQVAAACPDCRSAYEAALRRNFPEGWETRWQLQLDQRSYRRDDGYIVALMPESGEPEHTLQLSIAHEDPGREAPPEVERQTLTAQGIALMSPHTPEEMTLAEMPHHPAGRASDPTAVLGQVMQSMAVHDFFPDGWRENWKLAKDGASVAHVSGAVLYRPTSLANLPLGALGGTDSPQETCLLMLQAYAALFDKEPAEAVAICMPLMHARMMQFVQHGFDGVPTGAMVTGGGHGGARLH